MPQKFLVEFIADWIRDPELRKRVLYKERTELGDAGYKLDAYQVTDLLRLKADDIVKRLRDELEKVAGGGVALSPAVAARLAEAALPLAPGRLTDRERKVLDLVATGLTTAEIALRLRVSSAAVRRHLSSAVRQIVASRGGSPLDQQKERKP